jgi:hypothetical protein
MNRIRISDTGNDIIMVLCFYRPLLLRAIDNPYPTYEPTDGPPPPPGGVRIPRRCMVGV